MSTRNMWTDEIRTQVRAAVDAGVQKGKSKTEMYALLAPKYNVSVGALESAYRYNREQAARYARNARARQQGMVFNPTPTGTGVTMTAEEAIQFFRWQRQMNITIV